MSADIKQWQSAEGRSDDEMAALLSERLGRTISPQGYRIGRNRRDSPQDWLHALGIAPQEPIAPPSEAPASADIDGGGGGRKETPPALPLPFDPAPVRMQIALVYTAAGKGASIALRSPPVAEVWAQAAPGIAEAYIEWAKEDANVARILNAITLGGPKGILVMLHGTLIVNTLIVSGRFNPNRLVPPPMREPQESDSIADDGSPVVDLAGGGDNGDTGNDGATVPPQGKPRRSRAKATA